MNTAVEMKVPDTDQAKARMKMIVVKPSEIMDSIYGEDVNIPATPEEELALEKSIAESGVKVPLVCEANKNGRLEVVCGTRRLRIAKKLGLKEVPVIVMSFTSPEAKRQFAVKDNTERRQLSAVAKAGLGLDLWRSFDRDIEKKVRGRSGFTPRKRAAEAVGISEGTLANYRYIIDSGESDIIAKLQAEDLTVNAALTEVKKRMEEQDAPREVAPPTPLKVIRSAADVKEAANAVKALPALSARLLALADTAAKCGSADKKKLLKQCTGARESLATAKQGDILGKLIDALVKFESGLN